MYISICCERICRHRISRAMHCLHLHSHQHVTIFACDSTVSVTFSWSRVLASKTLCFRSKNSPFGRQGVHFSASERENPNDFHTYILWVVKTNVVYSGHAFGFPKTENYKNFTTFGKV